jgi:hypothetical protein
MSGLPLLPLYSWDIYQCSSSVIFFHPLP